MCIQQVPGASKSTNPRVAVSGARGCKAGVWVVGVNGSIVQKRRNQSLEMHL